MNLPRSSEIAGPVIRLTIVMISALLAIWMLVLESPGAAVRGLSH
jgi:hypothetical protein